MNTEKQIGVASTQPELSEIKDGFSQQIFRLRDNVELIENKLHILLNLKQPEPKGENVQAPESEPNDVMDSFHRTIKHIRFLNDRLDNAISHFNKIV